jgi:radical SAM superfamily enzyme YgiQ (UPF0313 family)
MFKARFRHRSVENIREHLVQMRRSDSRFVRFVTPTCLSYGSDDESVNLEAIERLLATAREILGADGRIYFGTFPSEVRPEHITEDALRLLSRYVDNTGQLHGNWRAQLVQASELVKQREEARSRRR